MLPLVIALAMLAQDASPATKTPAPPSAATPAKAKKPKRPPPSPDDIVCKEMNRPQSRFTDKVCLPRAEWDRAEDYAQDTDARTRGTRLGLTK